jgi:hypothetical protein
MIYTIPCQTGAGCSCGELPCDLCNGYTDLVAFAAAYNFPTSQTPNASFPFNYSGGNLTGITLWPSSDIVSTGGYLVRSGCFNIGPPYNFDDAWMYFTGVVKSNVTISYEYYLQDTGCVRGGKHRVLWIADTSDLTTATLQIGSWSNDNSNTEGIIQLQAVYDMACKVEQPPPQIPDFILADMLHLEFQS